MCLSMRPTLNWAEREQLAEQRHRAHQPLSGTLQGALSWIPTSAPTSQSSALELSSSSSPWQRAWALTSACWSDSARAPLWREVTEFSQWQLDAFQIISFRSAPNCLQSHWLHSCQQKQVDSRSLGCLRTVMTIFCLCGVLLALAQ